MCSRRSRRWARLDNTIVVFTTDNGAETITFPDGGATPFKGGKLTTWEGGMRAPMVVRWPGHIKPGTVKNQMFASLDWVPTLVDIAGGPKGDELKKQIEAGQYPGIVKTTLDGIDQRDFLEGKSKSARDTFFYYSGKDPSAVRYKNWKMYFAMVSDAPAGFIDGVVPYQWTQVVNIKRDPFETSVGSQNKTIFSMGGALASPSTAYVYDWNMLPIGQALWLKELQTYIDFPPLQDPASYNLEQVMQQVKNVKTTVARANNCGNRCGTQQRAPALHSAPFRPGTYSLRFGKFHQFVDRHRHDIGCSPCRRRSQHAKWRLQNLRDHGANNRCNLSLAIEHRCPEAPWSSQSDYRLRTFPGGLCLRACRQ